MKEEHSSLERKALVIAAGLVSIGLGLLHLAMTLGEED